jgi:hypothetical protein
MSVSLTEQAVRERRKTVTRRLGWRFLKRGDRLTLCKKVMGRKRGEPLDRICDVEVVSVTREPLVAIVRWGAQEVQREGFEWTPEGFMAFFQRHMRANPATIVTRIEWRYLDEEVDGPHVAADGNHHDHDPVDVDHTHKNANTGGPR